MTNELDNYRRMPSIVALRTALSKPTTYHPLGKHFTKEETALPSLPQVPTRGKLQMAF